MGIWRTPQFFPPYQPQSAEPVPASGEGYEQVSYRWRDDDGSETTASWLDVINTGITRSAHLVTRLRILTKAMGFEPPTQGLKLQYRKVGDTDWIDVS